MPPLSRHNWRRRAALVGTAGGGSCRRSGQPQQRARQADSAINMARNLQPSTQSRTPASDALTVAPPLQVCRLHRGVPPRRGVPNPSQTSHNECEDKVCELADQAQRFNSSDLSSEQRRFEPV